MRTASVTLAGILLCFTTGCAWRKPVAAPNKQRIVLHGIVDFNKSKIRPDSLLLVEEAARILKNDVDLRVLVEGHSDAKGDEAYNKKLSLRRATAVRDYLMALGVSSDQILVVGKGASEPVTSNDTRAGRAQNRRVQLEVYQE